jgi:type I restriction enzyme S subunit
MSKQKKNALVPALRFPEFRDKREWEERTLGDLSQIVRGGSPRPIDEYITPDANGLNWLKIADVDKESKYVTFTKERVLPTALSKTREVNPGDLIMSNSMSFGRPYILKIKSCIHDGWIAVTQIDEQASRDYLYYFILSPASQAYFVNNAAGSGVQNLNADIIKLLPVPFPKFSEQQKIADCLSSIDELITAEAKKLNALKTHKKGLMQNLFPAEGETVPRLRFKGYQGKWKEESFGKVIKINSGMGFKASEYSKTGVRLLQIENVGYGVTKWNENTIYLPENYTAEYPELVLRNGDIVLALNRPVTNDNLKIARLKKYDEPSILYQRVGKLEVLGDFLTVDFAFHVCRQFIKDFVVNKSIGSDQPFISLRDLYVQKILIPLPDEQQEISDCLSSIDELFAAQAEKVDGLKAHKKALMQQLFPVMDEAG